MVRYGEKYACLRAILRQRMSCIAPWVVCAAGSAFPNLTVELDHRLGLTFPVYLSHILESNKHEIILFCGAVSVVGACGAYYGYLVQHLDDSRV